MTRMHAKGPTARARAAKAAQRLRAYRKVCVQVDERDGYRCRCCGSERSLHHHHIRPRSLVRDDSAKNLCLVCVVCHTLIHARKLLVGGSDANATLTVERVQ